MGFPPGQSAGAPIGLDDSGPFQFTTDGVAAPAGAVSIDLARIPVAGGTVVLLFTLGGVDPADPTTNNYIVTGALTATRVGDVTTVEASQLSKLDNGATVTVTVAGAADGRVQVLVAVTGVPGYRHTVKIESAQALAA